MLPAVARLAAVAAALTELDPAAKVEAATRDRPAADAAEQHGDEGPQPVTLSWHLPRRGIEVDDKRLFPSRPNEKRPLATR
jgi:hypothetical protein